MRAEWVLVLLAFTAGTAVPVQFAVNAEMRGAVGGPVVAAAISFVVGTLADFGTPRGGAGGTRRSAVILGSGGGAVVGVGWRLPRGVLRNGLDNTDPTPGRGNLRRLHNRGPGGHVGGS